MVANLAIPTRFAVNSARMGMAGISTVLLSSGHVRESTGRDIFLASPGAFRALKARSTR